MALVFRTDGDWGSGKGSKLDAEEVDNNFYELDQRLDELETNGVQPNEISSVQVVGTQLTFFLEDGTSFGPFTLPTAVFTWRGDWATDTDYTELDLVFVTGEGLFMVLQDHTSDAYGFDADAVGEDSSSLYHLLFAVPDFTVPAASLSLVGDVNIGGPLIGDTLRYNGEDWVNEPTWYFIKVDKTGAVSNDEVLYREIVGMPFRITIGNFSELRSGYKVTTSSGFTSVELRKNGTKVGEIFIGNTNNIEDADLDDDTDFDRGDVLELVASDDVEAASLSDFLANIAAELTMDDVS